MKLGKVTLYVEDQDQAIEFWTNKIGFKLNMDQQTGPVRWVEVNDKQQFVCLVLYSKNAMKQVNPDKNLEAPSLLFSTNDIEKSYHEMLDNGVKVDELMIMPYGKMLTFYDQDNNQYVLREDQW